MASEERVEIPGSERQLEPAHPRVAQVDRNQTIEVTVYLRPSGSLDWVDEEALRAPAERRTLSREELAGVYRASDEDVDALRSFASRYGLEVNEVDQGRRAVKLRGTVDAVARAFGVPELHVFEHPKAGRYRARQGPLTVPRELDGVITGVFGIDDRPQTRPQLRAQAAAAAATSYTPLQVAAAYDFPASVTGAGETVGIIELGGGYTQSDLDSYFQSLGLTPPTVSSVSVDGAANSPSGGQGADVEVTLDIEVAGAVAPGARFVVYFAPNTDQGFIDAVSTAVHDSTNKPSVISISWGGPEDSWTKQARTEMEQILTEGAAAGVTVTAASGDDGSTDGVSDGSQHVDFPASAPHMLACGGTTLRIEGDQIASEVVWNDLPTDGAGGGGISIEFPVPSYQAGLPMPPNVDTDQAGRGVPDVSGDADPQTGYSILVGGVDQSVGGTSAVAPLWAGLIALVNQALGQPVGFFQPRLYQGSASGGFRDITEGDNGAYSAATGWDPCTGLGSPEGSALLAALDGGSSTST
jgi:kumamolisin